MDVAKDLVAAASEPVVLSLLKEGDSYGYAIIQRVKQLSSGEFHWSDGMLYPVLHRLERQGAVEAYWRAGETGRRRKYYRLRPQGVTKLDDLKSQWTMVHRTLDQLWQEDSNA